MGETQEFKCKITHLYKNCPKPDGWFGCFAKKYGDDARDIKLTGITDLPLANNMQLNVIAEQVSDDEYKTVHISIVTKTSKGMVSYLTSLPGVGRITAEKLVREYGTDAIDILKNDPDTVKSVLGLSDKKIKSICDAINKNDTFNNLRKFLLEIQSPVIIVRITEMFAHPIDDIKKDPYALLSVPGISFQTADTIALRLGEHPLSPYRVNHGIVYVIKTMYQNDMYIDLNDSEQLYRFMAQVESKLQIRFSSIKEFIDRLVAFSAIKDCPIYIDRSNNGAKLYLSELYHSMMMLAHIIKDKASSNHTAHNAVTQTSFARIRQYEVDNHMVLTDEQVHACKMALTNNISVITGGPGRGKTSVIDCIATSWLAGLARTVTLLAPTGKAMNKLKTATNAKFDTMTIDRLIVSTVNIKTKTKSNYKPITDEKDHLFIVDESSMIDIQKAADLMTLYPMSSYCFVGDVDQLPPIMPGHFLKDLIDSGVIPISYLTQPLRNSGSILSNAEKINKNDINLQWDFTSMPFYPQTADDQTALDNIIDQYNDERITCADITQLALLCPMKKGMLGAMNLNMTIQDIVCPENEQPQSIYDNNHKRNMYVRKGHPIKSTIYGNGERYTRFRIGDIVMNTKNQNTISTFTYSNDDYWNGKPTAHSIGIFNGDCGKIIAYIPADPNCPSEDDNNHEIIVVQFFDNRIANIDLTAGEFETFDLGYALTVHKSQGCEYNTVMYISPHSLLNLKSINFGTKNLVYTAVTRAKKRVVVMGSKESLNECITTNLISRKSDFAEKLKTI